MISDAPSASDPRVDAYLKRLTQWREERFALRNLLRHSALVETFKWDEPCYTWKDKNVAMIPGFRGYCGLSFFKGVMMTDPTGLLKAPGANSRSVRWVLFTSLEEITEKSEALLALVTDAIRLESQGRSMTSMGVDAPYPQELIERFSRDPVLKSAFDALTPGRRRGYLLNIAEATSSATRLLRIKRWAPRIIKGKGMQDR